MELHRWERAADGELVRSLEYVGERGEITRWHGQPQEVELNLGLPATDTRPDPTLDQTDIHVDEDHLMRVAAAWSVDPTSLDDRPATGSLTLGRLPTTTHGRRTAEDPLRTSVPFDVTDLIISGRSSRTSTPRSPSEPGNRPRGANASSADGVTTVSNPPVSRVVGDRAANSRSGMSQTSSRQTSRRRPLSDDPIDSLPCQCEVAPSPNIRSRAFDSGTAPRAAAAPLRWRFDRRG